MRVLRENKDSLMAVLEAFVYDPLINWRLLDGEMLNHKLLLWWCDGYLLTIDNAKTKNKNQDGSKIKHSADIAAVGIAFGGQINIVVVAIVHVQLHVYQHSLSSPPPSTRQLCWKVLHRNMFYLFQ